MGFVNLCTMSHYSNTDNLKSNPDYSPSNENDYIEIAKEYGHKTLVFAERNNIHRWYSKKMLLENNNMKYVHAVRMNVITELSKEASVYSLLLIAKNYDGVLEINRLVGESFYGRNDDSVKNPNFYFVPRTELKRLKELNNVIFVFAEIDNPLWGTKKTNKDSELNSWLKFLKDTDSYVGVASSNRNENEYMNEFMIGLVDDSKIVAVDLTKSHEQKLEYIRFLLNKSQNSKFESDNIFQYYKQDKEIVRGLVDTGIPEDKAKQYMDNTEKIIDEVEEFEMDNSFKYPRLFDNPKQRFQSLIKKGLLNKIKGNVDKDKYKEYIERANHEYKVIESTGSIEFMLLEQYVKEEMRKRDIYPGSGRGSVGGSLIAYLLDITDVDPIKEGLIFERFMNKDRISLADIDSDYAPDDKKVVQEFLLEHPKLKSASIITFGTFGIKGAVKDIGRAMDYPPGEMQALSNSIDDYGKEYTIGQEMRERYKLLIEHAESIVGLISHSGRHPAGIVVSDIDILETIGTVKVKGFDYPVTSWDMGEVEANKYVKLDILGLINVEWVKRATELANLDRLHSQSDIMDYNDWSIRDDILEYGTATLFQLEEQESATMKMLSDETIANIKKYNPDITMVQLFSIITAVIRPGSASIMNDVLNGIYHDYRVPEINELLKDSFGHLIYQEQTIALIQYAGFTASEADNIRRAISKKKSDTINNWIPEFKKTLVNKILNDYPDRQEDEIIEMVDGLAQVIIDSSSYSFNKAHAIEYSYITMQTAWLRKHYPTEWLTAGYQIWSGRLDKMKTIGRVAKAKGIEIQKMKFRKSKALHFFDDSKVIYEGVLPIKGMNEQVGDFLYDYSHDKKYDSFSTFLLDVTDPFILREVESGEVLDKNFYDLDDDELKALDKLIKAEEVEIISEDVKTPNKGQMLSLIRLDYFSEFGSMAKLEKIYEFFKNKYNKSNKTIKSKANNFNKVLDKEIDTKEEETSVYEKAMYEVQYLEKCTIKDDRVPPQYALVTKVDFISKSYTSAQIHSFNKGVTTSVRVGSRTYNQVPFKDGDIIEIGSSKLKERWNNPNEKDLWINNIKYIRKSDK